MEHVIKIAAVDDIQTERERLAVKIKEYMDNKGFIYKLLHYKSGEDFVEALKKEHFDIVFMDIFMEGMTGIEAAGKLREISMDCKLVFLTSSRDFLEEGYAYNPCHYLLKPFDDEKFEKAMYNCQIKRQLAVPFLDVVFEGSAKCIDTMELMYIDICDRITTLHMANHTLAVAGSMKKVVEPLCADKRFIRCIQGVLVNMDYISDIEINVFILKNGEKLPIAIRNKKNMIRQYLDYQFQRASNRGGTCL